MSKRYTNFKDIDRDIKYLRLKSQIDLEELKLSFNSTQEEFKSSLSPINLIKNTIGAILQKAFVLKAVDMLLGIKKVKEVDDDTFAGKSKSKKSFFKKLKNPFKKK